MSLISSKAGDHCSYLNPGAVTLDGLPKKGLVALYSLAGQDPVLNPGARWYTPVVNQLLSSEDMTATWAVTDVTVDDSTHLTFDAQNGNIRQTIPTSSGMAYTLYIRALNVDGNADIKTYFNGLTPIDHDLTLTGSLADYVQTVTGDGAPVAFGLRDANAAGHGQIEVTRWMLAVGTHTAAEMAAMYELTTDRQAFVNFANPGTSDAQSGSTSGSDTNDPTLSWESRNLLAAGSANDLTDAAWTDASGIVDDADNLTFAAQNDLVSQDVTTVAGVTYTLSAKIRAVTGNTDLHFYHNNSATGTSTAQAVTATLTRYEVSVLGRAGGGAVSFGIQDQNAGGFGQIEIEEWQVEVGSTASTFTDPVESGRPVMGFDGVDDYVAIGTNLLDGSAGTYIAMVRTTASVASNGQAIYTGKGTGSLPTVGQMYSLVSGKVRLIIADGTDYAEAVSDVAVNDGQYYVSAATFSANGSVQTYINGVADGAAVSAASVDTAQNGHNDTIGALVTAGVFHPFDGDIGPVAVYSRALSPGEVTQLTNVIAQRAWDYSGIVIPGSSVDYSVPPSKIDEP